MPGVGEAGAQDRSFPAMLVAPPSSGAMLATKAKYGAARAAVRSAK